MNQENWIEMMENMQDVRQFCAIYVRRNKIGNISSAQELDLLSRLELSSEKLTPNMICSLMGISKWLGSRLISQLIEKGFLKKEANGSDKRSYFLIITPDGSKELQKTYAYYLEPIYALKRKLGAEKYEILTKLIRESIT